MIQTVSANTFYHSDAGIFYHIQDGQFFPTKWLAIDYAFNKGLSYAQIIKQLRCCLNKDVSWENYDWTKEPSESWDEILKNRFQWYRDKYNYIALSYSGGADSQVLLDTALRHKIKLDEILIYASNLDGLGKDFHDHLNWEIDQVAIPRLKATNLSLIGNPKIEIWQMDSWELLKEAYTEEYVFNHSSRTFEKYSAPLAGITMQTEKENGVIIRGCTHPTVLYDDELDKFYVEIWDTDNFICGSQSSNRLSFFTSPEAPWVHAKQCHMVKNYLRKHKLFSFTAAKEAKYRKIFQTLCRTEVLNRKSPFFDKKHVSSLNISRKAEAFSKYMYKIYPELFKDLLGVNNTKLHGIPLYRYPEGVLMGKFYLE